MLRSLRRPPAPVRILVLFNPFAGAGRAPAMARSLAASLEERGHACSLLETRPGADSSWLESALSADVDLLVVVGGDGAVRLAAASAARAGVALWQSPLGTENLFAREWAMAGGAAALLRAIDGGAVDSTDLGDANGAAFTLMASVGFDAEVVHDLAVRRRGAISHLSYATPILRAVFRHRPKRLRVQVDGVRLDDGSPGFVVVANARQYAMRMNPVPTADPRDGQVDARWFPAKGVCGVAGWSVRCLLGLQSGSGRQRTARGRQVVVECDEPFLYQLDGDPPPGAAHGRAVARLLVGVRSERLRVLTGASGN